MNHMRIDKGKDFFSINKLKSHKVKSFNSSLDKNRIDKVEFIDSTMGYGCNVTTEKLRAENMFAEAELRGIKRKGISSNSNCFHLHNSRIDSLTIAKNNIALCIIDVDLSQSTIYIGDKERFEDTMYQGSISIEDSKFKGVIWETDNIIFNGFSPRDSYQKHNLQYTALLRAREFYGEMRRHYADRGDGVVAAQFYATEMKAHRAYLLKRYPKFFSWESLNNRLFSEISYWTSDFGQKWLNALMWYLSLGILFLSLTIVVKYGKIDLDFARTNWLEAFSEFASLLVRYYTPTNVLVDKIFEIDYSIRGTITILIWIVWKIISAYLIFQMYIASRKYVRKL